MSVSSQDDFQQIWSVVRGWPKELREKLGQELLASVNPAPAENYYGRPWRDIRDLVGLAARDAPPPDDEEVKRIIEDELTKKYLRE
jgi:hypothetical protein